MRERDTQECARILGALERRLLRRMATYSRSMAVAGMTFERVEQYALMLEQASRASRRVRNAIGWGD